MVGLLHGLFARCSCDEVVALLESHIFVHMSGHLETSARHVIGACVDHLQLEAHLNRVSVLLLHDVTLRSEHCVEVCESHVTVELCDRQLVGQVRVTSFRAKALKLFEWFLQSIQIIVGNVSPIKFVAQAILLNELRLTLQLLYLQFIVFHYSIELGLLLLIVHLLLLVIFLSVENLLRKLMNVMTQIEAVFCFYFSLYYIVVS